uniref:Uncharacterized protein n=1 Tax=Avena sativa TaxID=4498 RepID=A0ACD5Z1D1_AVESA
MEIPAAVLRAQRAEGPATVLAIGTATPDNFMYQADYPDYYFRVTKSEHLVDLKRKFKRMCDGTMIRKRYMHLTEEYIQENPNMAEFMAPSFNARRAILCNEIPKLAKKASERAIKEWGQPMSKISHLVFCTTTGVGMPSFDYQLVKLLGLNPSVKRVMLYMQGCFAGGTVLRVAKDLAENNHGARVLVVCAEMNAMYFRGPSAARLDSLVGQALFGDGAAALIIGADPEVPMERPLFQVVSTSQTILPDTDGFIVGDLLDGGLTLQLNRDVPVVISKNILSALVDAFAPMGITDWNSIFWVAHPGGAAILDMVEAQACLDKKRMRATRHILSEYGNMSSACVLFILDEIRKRSAQEGMATTGEGMDWGVLFGFGPGLTVETVVLRSVPIAAP